MLNTLPMANRQELVDKGVECFLRIANRLKSDDRQALDYGTGDPLHMGEIHTIDAVGRLSRPNVTELAGALGVTKGAVSQMITRLEKKGHVRKWKDSGQGNELSVELTRKGKIAYSGHIRFHALYYKGLFEDFSEKQLVVIMRALRSLEKHVEQNSLETTLKKKKRDIVV